MEMEKDQNVIPARSANFQSVRIQKGVGSMAIAKKQVPRTKFQEPRAK